ncbi:MAG: RNA methyltransferase [Corynebacterium sp.]|nr:RNA methyltransferase [Corynebacterium sp.]
MLNSNKQNFVGLGADAGLSPDKPGPTEWFPHPIGVGPWAEEHPGEPLPEGEQWDLELLENGDTRNVIDRYRYWTREAIVADIDTRRHSLHIAIENFTNDSNIGTVVRTANAFAVDTVHIVGRRRWNRRGAMVTDRYQHLMHHDTVAEVVAWAKEHGLTVVAIDNTPGCVPLERTELPERCLLLFGQEGPGVSPEAQQEARMTCSIAQFGSTRSINAGVAAGIAMHTWIRQHADLSKSV